MKFDFKLFSALVKKAYGKHDDFPYSVDDVLAVFQYYFQAYEDTFKKAHPPIRMEQIERIINYMPFLDREYSQIPDIGPEEYSALINKHFKTQYQNCDYNINHFFSGDIRKLRFYEVLLWR